MSIAYASSMLWFWVAFGLLLVVIFLLISHGKRMKAAEKYAMSDAASGALNSEGFRREASRILKASTPEHALVAMELRNYRQLTRTFGGEQSDRVLVYLNATMRRTLGSSEPVARISRGTFCFLIKNRQKDAISARLMRIYENANQFNHTMAVPFQMDLVFGIYLPEHNDEALSVMQEKALSLLDLDKDHPRYRFYSKVKADKNGARWPFIEQMNASLKNGDFIVYMQPKVRLGDKRIVGAEALVRWRHPQRGMLTPEMFIPLLEEYRLIHRFDLYLFEMVCQKLYDWKLLDYDACPVSVNLSLQTLENESFMEPYIRLVQKYRVAPELIEFELSEPILFEKPEKLRTLIDEIHSYGFHCSLDHFGQSAIPLQLLRQLEVDTVKLDRSFFTSENNSRPNRYIVEAILKITSQMQVRTVAEGIDNASQVQYLQQAGCDMIQGFCYYKPMPIDEFQKIAFDDGHLRYVEDPTEERPNHPKELPTRPASSNNNNIIMFTLLESHNRVVFSDVFSPLLYGQLSISEASALFNHSDLIHENDRRDFAQLIEQAHKHEGWVKNSIRLYTSEARYEWLEVHMHHETTANGDSVISGVLVNMANLNGEVNRWMEKANRDPLTGLFNREYFEVAAANIIRKGATSCAIIFFDLDNFKQVNDTLGHMGGDDALCFIAKCLLGTFRHTDIVARFGGDEFVIFANDIQRYDLEKRLQELCTTLRVPYRNGDINYRLSGSIGAAIYPDDAQSYADLLDRADTAAYVAKERGKAQYVLYSHEMAKVVKQDIR